MIKCLSIITILFLTGCSMKQTDENNINSKKYKELSSVYEHVVANKTVENAKLTAVDYLKLYKKLKTSNEETFQKVKINLINKFMLEIKDQKDLEANYIYLVLLEENLQKVDDIIYQLL